MHKNRIKQYKRLFPDIDLDKRELSDSDLIVICEYYEPHLRTDREVIRSQIVLFPRDYPKPSEIKRLIKERITNPDNKVGASKRTKKFWELRGYTSEEATDIISTMQKQNSPRSVQYWINRGYSNDESIQKVSETQAENARKMHQTLSDNGVSISVWTESFWIDRGYAEHEAKNKVSEYQRTNSKKHWDSLSPSERKKTNVMCVESWLAKGKTISDYEEFRGNIRSNRTRSKIADEFCSELESYFPSNKIYCKDREYGKFIPGYKYVKYDYVDLDQKVVVEFNGEYWHSSEDAKRNDERKKDFVINTMGFRYFVVTDKEYNNDKQTCIQTLVENIKDINHANSSQID